MPIQLSSPPMTLGLPSWSSDGKRLVVWRWRSNAFITLSNIPNSSGPTQSPSSKRATSRCNSVLVTSSWPVRQRFVPPPALPCTKLPPRATGSGGMTSELSPNTPSSGYAFAVPNSAPPILSTCPIRSTPPDGANSAALEQLVRPSPLLHPQMGGVQVPLGSASESLVPDPALAKPKGMPSRFPIPPRRSCQPAQSVRR
jgi:hypothetical protein